MTHNKFLALLLLTVWFVGCATMSPTKPVTAPEPEASEPTALGIKMQVLHHITQGYVALQGGNAPLAFQHFDAVEQLGYVVPDLSLIKATMLIQSGAIDRAMTEIDKALAIAPENVDLLLLKAGVLAAQGEREAAIVHYQRVLDSQPNNEMAAVFSAGLYEELGQKGKAQRLLTKFTRRNRNAAQAFFQLGRMRLDEKDWRGADEAFVRATNLMPENGRAWVGLGYAAENLGEKENAIAAYERAVALSPGDNVIRRHLISLHLRANDPEAAMAETKRLEELIGGGASESRLTLGIVFYHQGKTPEALGEFNLVLEQEPGNNQALYLAGICLARLNKTADAMAHYEKILPESAYYLDARLNLATLLMRVGRSGDALAELDLLSKPHPQDLDVLRTRATVLSHMGRFDQAEVTLTKALKIKPDDPDLVYSLAIVYERSGRWRKSVALMEKRLQATPDDVDAMNFIGYTLADHDSDLSRAEELLARAVEIKPHSGHIVDSYGWILYRLGRFEDAIKYLKRALEIEPSEAIIAEHVGDAYAAAGDLEAAREYWRSANTLNPDPATAKRLKEKLGE